MPARAHGRHVLLMRRLRPMRISSLNVDVLALQRSHITAEAGLGEKLSCDRHPAVLYDRS